MSEAFSKLFENNIYYQPKRFLLFNNFFDLFSIFLFFVSLQVGGFVFHQCSEKRDDDNLSALVYFFRLVT